MQGSSKPAATMAASVAPASAGAKVADGRPPANAGMAARQRGLAQLHRTGYSYEGVDNPEYLSTPWVQPDVLKARDYYVSQLFEKGAAPIFSTTIEQLSNLGVGITLHFRLIKYLAYFFTFASLLAVPIFALCYAGSRISDDEMDPLNMAGVSIANIGDTGTLANYTVAPWPASTLRYSSREVSAIIMACDFAIVWMFLLFVLFVSGRIKAVAAEVDASVITASDYAVFVQGLPKDATEDEIREHFNRLYNLRKADWVFASSWKRCFIGRKMAQRRQFKIPQKDAGAEKRRPKPASGYRELRDDEVYPVLDARNTGNQSYLRSWVAEVSVATANGTLIKRYQALSGLLQRIRQARAAVKKYNTGSPYADEKKKAHALKKLADVEKTLDVIDKKYSKEYRDETVGAFVVFNNEESFRRCVYDYDGSDSWFSFRGFWLQPPPLLFRDKHRLSVTKAPDPSQVVWQNLELSSCNRLMRQTGVNLLLGALLVVSFIFIILAQAQQSRFRANIPDTRVCNAILPGLAYGLPLTSTGQLASGSLPTGLELLHDPTDPYCTSVGAHRIFWYSSTGLLPQTSRNASNPCLNECVRNDMQCQYTISDTGRNASFPMTSAVACYCSRKLIAALSKKGVLTGAQSIVDDDGRLCAQVAVDYVTYNAFVLVASAIVVIINVFLRTILKTITALEGHPSVAAMQKAIALKVFLSLFLNTACLVLLINAALPSVLSNVSINGQQVFSGQYTGFDTRWHVAVGTGIVLTMFINIVTPHMYALYWLFCFLPCRRLSGDKTAVTQAQLNHSYTPPSFEMPTPTAVIMNTVFCCLMYSSGHPVLLPIAAFSMMLTYWVDKSAILRMYRRPPMYDEAMGVFASSMLPWAAVVHLFVAIWMYSDQNVLYSPRLFGAESSELSAVAGQGLANSFGAVADSAAKGDSSGLNIVARLTRENTLPLFALLVLFLGIWLLYSTAGVALMALLRQCLSCVSGGRCCKDRAGASMYLHFNPPYTGPYSLLLDPKKENVLAQWERRSGWDIVQDKHGNVVKIRTWPTTGVTFGLPHKKGQRMLTWQVIAFAGIASYDIAANPLYSPAVRAMEAGRVKAEQERAKKKGVKGKPSFRRVGAAATSGMAGLARAPSRPGGITVIQAGAAASPLGQGDAGFAGQPGAVAQGAFPGTPDAGMQAAMQFDDPLMAQFFGGGYDPYAAAAYMGGAYGGYGMMADPNMAAYAGGGIYDPNMAAAYGMPGAAYDPYGMGMMGMPGGAAWGGGMMGYQPGFDPAALAMMGFDAYGGAGPMMPEFAPSDMMLGSGADDPGFGTTDAAPMESAGDSAGDAYGMAPIIEDEEDTSGTGADKADASDEEHENVQQLDVDTLDAAPTPARTGSIDGSRPSSAQSHGSHRSRSRAAVAPAPVEAGAMPTEAEEGMADPASHADVPIDIHGGTDGNPVNVLSPGAITNLNIFSDYATHGAEDACVHTAADGYGDADAGAAPSLVPAELQPQQTADSVYYNMDMSSEAEPSPTEVQVSPMEPMPSQPTPLATLPGATSLGDGAIDMNSIIANPDVQRWILQSDAGGDHAGVPDAPSSGHVAQEDII